MTAVVPVPKQLNAKIAWARRQRGLSQELFAEMVGTSRRHVMRIEKGEHRPRRELLARIAVITQQPEEFFADEEGDPG